LKEEEEASSSFDDIGSILGFHKCQMPNMIIATTDVSIKKNQMKI
jgi:hypothetical protein